MAATTAFSSLAVPGGDDKMEMSSPARPLVDDDDIDLDLDADFGGGVQLPDDERMLSDGEPTRPPTASDELMEDEAQTHIEEAEMDDDTTVTAQPAGDGYDHDDLELIDYDDEDVEATQSAEAQSTIPDMTPAGLASQEHLPVPGAQVDAETTPAPDNSGLGGQSPTLPLDPIHGTQPNEPVTAPLELKEYDDEPTVVGHERPFTAADEKEEPVSAPADDTDLTESNKYGGEHIQPNMLDSEAEQPQIIIDTSYHATGDGPATPTDTGLHPMTLYYDDHVMPLFKSKNQPDGLLKDDNLANLSLNELMRNCRQRLALKIGNVPEEKELFLSFYQLDLILVGASDAAFEHSLSDVLEVYMRLHQNDGAREIPPLSLTLSSNQFSSQLSMLKQAAALGHGMSAYLPQTEDEEEVVVDVDVEEQEYCGEDGEDNEHAWAPCDENAQDEHYEEDAEHGEYAEEYLEDSFDGPDDQNAEDRGAESYDGHQDTPEDGVNQTTQDEQYEVPEPHQEDSQEYHLSDPAATGTEVTPTGHEPGRDNGTNVDESAGHQPPTKGDAKKAESETSSATLEGDQADSSTELHGSATVNGDPLKERTGEYDEGLNRWHDDDPTQFGSESHRSGALQCDKVDSSTESHDAGLDGSTLATEHETEETQVDEHKAERTSPESLSGRTEHELTTPSGHDMIAADDLTGPVDCHEQFASEGNLNEYDETQYDNPAVSGEEEQDDHSYVTYEEQYENRADTFQEQQEDGEEFGVEDEEQQYEVHDPPNGVENQDTGLEYGLEPGRHEDEEPYCGDDPLQSGEEKYKAERDFEHQPGEDEIHQQDEIGYDDDITPPPPPLPKSSTDAPLRKRSFDEHVEQELVFEEGEPEPKKTRSN
ncbi:hypothetical protein M433DRAFT_140352 [Acidomyces richmondensis BFW]|nr:MAG: hypothetical protein FE78DRAFT_467487 [Acidomyces sp. 'richmondensis']KYG49163.1 hypothetical protein M433DRAFT_140352 [Acidomyces richmondensis BFW]